MLKKYITKLRGSPPLNFNINYIHKLKIKRYFSNPIPP